jgi:biotin synthase
LTKNPFLIKTQPVFSHVVNHRKKNKTIIVYHKDIYVMIDPELNRIATDLINGARGSITLQEAFSLTTLTGAKLFDLLACADKIRRRFKKDNVFTCVIINAKSGRCSQDCAFCAQSAHHKTGVSVYPLLEENTLFQNALFAQKAGATNYSMVTSGHRLSDKDMERVCKVAEKIVKETDLTVCASLGALTGDMANQLKQSGITNYHHNLETARSYFHNICTTHDYDEDILTLKEASSSGLRVCSGGIMGLGESWEQRIELAFTLKELEVDSIPINFLNPIPGTKLENRPLMKPLDALKSIALFRMINPEKDITICGGREITLKDMQSWVFVAGANGLMTGNYLTTQGRNIEMDMEMIESLGLVADGKESRNSS